MYADRYYSSIPLTQPLQDAGTSFTGTLVKSRVGLTEVVCSSSFSLQGGEVRGFRAGSLLCVAWQAATKKKPVVMLSSDCTHQMANVRGRNRTQLKPVVVDQYNHSMNGVDIAEQYTCLLLLCEEDGQVVVQGVLENGGGGSQQLHSLQVPYSQAF